MTEPSTEEKQKYCEELNNFIEDTENYMKEVCSFLGWSFDSIKEEDEAYITCPFNEGHRVPERTIQKHLEKCEWNTLGYTKDCKSLSEPTLPLESPSTIKFDMQLQHQILQEAKQKHPELNIGEDERLIPQTSDRLTSDFTSDERKAMYEYVIANTVAPDIGHHDITDISKPNTSNVKSTPIIELLAQERNLKRRRAKHRGVHTNKKSQTEILREVIEQQMEMYKEYISEKYDIPIADLNNENNFNFQHNENDKIKKNIKSDLNENSNSSSVCADHKSIGEESQYHNDKSKYDSKTNDEKSERNSKYYDRNDSAIKKYTNHYKDYNDKSLSNDQVSRDSWKSTYRDKDRDKHEYRKHYKSNSWDRKRDDSDYYSKRYYDSGSRDRKCDNSDFCDRKRDDSDSYSKKHNSNDSHERRHDADDDFCTIEDNNSDSHERKRYDSGSYDKKQEKSVSRNTNHDYTDSRRKRDRSKSNEKSIDNEFKDYHKERVSHKKHKKDYKKRKDHKRNRSLDSDDDRKYKSSKHKRTKYRSRSRS